MAAMTGTHKRNGLQQATSECGNGSTSTTKKTNKTKSSKITNTNKERRLSSPDSTSKQQQQQPRTFAVLFLGCVAVLGLVQLTFNVVLFQAMEDTQSGGIPKPSLATQLQTLQQQVLQWQEQTQLYSDDGKFYPFSIRDSRRLVPTQLPPGFHVWDYVDITTQNQQKTKRASLFHNARLQAPAICQEYNLLCYKQKIIQVFDLVLKENPTTEYFFYMEADNELCTTLTDIRRLAYQYERYFITTGIGFSGWIMQRQFMIDFIQLLKDYVPPPMDPKDILSQQGPKPSEGPDPIAADFLIDHQSWTVTRQYLVSHSIQPSLGVEALTVRMPVAAAAADAASAAVAAVSTTNKSQTVAEAAAALKGNNNNNKGLDKHLPRCWEPRRSKWRISKKDHRDRFGWDYFDYDECDGEVFPCYAGQLEELLVRDMASFNYTQLDLDREKLIKKQQDKQRKKLLKDKEIKEGGGIAVAGPAAVMMHQEMQRAEAAIRDHQLNNNNPRTTLNDQGQKDLSERFKELMEKARIRHAERLKAQNGGGTGLRGGATL
jgi:hypothetical protein